MTAIFSEGPKEPESLASKMARATIAQKLALLFPVILLLAVVSGIGLYFSFAAQQEDSAREYAVSRLVATIPDPETTDQLRAEVQKLVALIPASAFQASQKCHTGMIERFDNKSGNEGQKITVPQEVCQDIQADATVSLDRIHEKLNDIDASAQVARSFVNRLNELSMNNYGVAYANQKPPAARVIYREKKTSDNLLYYLCGAFFICILLMLISKNTRFQEWCLDTLKLLVGAFLGIVGAHYGIRV